MARIETWFNQDLKRPVKVHYLDGNVFSSDNSGNLIGVNVFDNGEPASLSGTVSGSAIRSDGATVALTGSLYGNQASVVLPAAAYAVPGVISIVIKLTLGSAVTTLCAVVSNVYQSSTSTAVDPGTIIPDVEALVAAINEAVASIPSDYSALLWSLRDTDTNVLANCNPDDYSSGGITATRVDRSTYHFEGTISSSSFIGFYESTTIFPNWLQKGRTYALVIEGASANNTNGIYFDIIGFQNGTTQVDILTPKYANGRYEFSIPSSFSGGLYIRAGWLGSSAGHVVNETIRYKIFARADENILTTDMSMHFMYNTSGRYTSCNDVPTGVTLFVSSNQGVLDLSDFPINGAGTLACFGSPDYRIQYAFSYNKTPIQVMVRSYGASGWGSWFDMSSVMTVLGWLDPNNTNQNDLNKIDKDSIWFVATSSGVSGIDNYPYSSPGVIMTYVASASIRWQMAYPWDTSKPCKYRVLQSGTWTNWADIGGGGQTVTITQEVSRDTYNNSYDISVSPQITTDSNGWLQAIDTNTESESGKTDMTSAIMAMLTDTGYCHLGPGIFYVSGNIDMPANSLLEGCGKQTIIRLLQSVSSGYIVRMHTKSTVKNLTFSGGYNDGDISDSNIGGRIGINYIGNRDGQSTGVTPATCTCCMIEGCWFENLDSGFYGYNAGGGLQEGVICNNCYFTRCKAGINIDYWTEYCKFTNCIIFQCYFACINNGGNNVFTACTFHGVIGFLIDNSSGTKTNNAHGTVNGCTFNHIDNMNHPETLGNGYGVKVIDTEAGFIFTGCQFWYGKVYVEGSTGVQFSDCEFGGNPTLETSGNGTVFFDGCLFQSTPTKYTYSPVIFDNCYTYAGTAVTQS